MKVYPRNQALYHLMYKIHGTLLIGAVGDALIETATSLTILMIITGAYLWWSRRGSIKALFFAKIGGKRNFWLNLHGLFGAWTAAILLLFCLSGVAWAGIWGEKVVQAWSQFPAGKWGVQPIPESVVTHGDALNDDGGKNVPWILEQTPMPQSGTTMGEKGIKEGEPLTLETLDRYARETGFKGRYHLNTPTGEKGVWTLSQDSMSYDASSPFIDRTVHIDQYSGKVLADIRYDDYNAFGKFMAVSIALHMGTLGWWSVAANILFCLAVIFVAISGWIMWWKRRPSQATGLMPPPRQYGAPTWWAMAVPLLVVAALFPTALVAIAVVWLLDTLVISRIAALRTWFH